MTTSPDPSCARGPDTQLPQEPRVVRAACREVAVALLLGLRCSARWAPAPQRQAGTSPAWGAPSTLAAGGRLQLHDNKGSFEHRSP